MTERTFFVTVVFAVAAADADDAESGMVGILRSMGDRLPAFGGIETEQGDEWEAE